MRNLGIGMRMEAKKQRRSEHILKDAAVRLIAGVLRRDSALQNEAALAYIGSLNAEFSWAWRKHRPCIYETFQRGCD